MTELFTFNIFGSTNSQEYDILFHVPEIIKDQNMSNLFCMGISYFIELNDKNKRIVLCTTKNGIINKVSIGLPDELNNSLFYTYALHKQYHPCLVNRSVKRNIPAKIKLVIKEILRILSETQYKQKILPVINKEFNEQYEVFKSLELDNLSFLFNIESEDQIDTKVKTFKQAAIFELMQCIGLLDNIEIYTAMECYYQYNILVWDDISLNEIKNKLVEKIEKEKFLVNNDI